MNQWRDHPEFFGEGNYRRPQPRNGRIIQASQQPALWSKLILYTGASMMSTATTLAALTVAGMVAY